MSELLTPDKFIKLLGNNPKIYGYVYLTTNVKTKKIYIGQSKKLDAACIFNYFGSGKIISKVDKTYCVKHILKYAYDLYELSDWEEFYINFYKSYDREIGYNISKSASYFNKRNISGLNNPASKNKMSNDKLINKALKAAETRRTTVLKNGKTIQENIAEKTKITNSQIDEITGKTKAQLLALKSHMTQLKNGSRYKRIQNMIKTKNETGSFLIGAKKAGETNKKNGTFKGKKNPKAKKYILISPNNEIYHIHGELKAFVKNKNLQIRLLRQFINRGKIFLKSKNFSSIKSYNTIGWEITYDE